MASFEFCPRRVYQNKLMQRDKYCSSVTYLHESLSINLPSNTE